MPIGREESGMKTGNQPAIVILPGFAVKAWSAITFDKAITPNVWAPAATMIVSRRLIRKPSHVWERIGGRLLREIMVDVKRLITY